MPRTSLYWFGIQAVSWFNFQLWHNYINLDMTLNKPKTKIVKWGWLPNCICIINQFNKRDLSVTIVAIVSIAATSISVYIISYSILDYVICNNIEWNCHRPIFYDHAYNCPQTRTTTLKRKDSFSKGHVFVTMSWSPGN